VGSSLKAVLFAFNNELPIFFSEIRRPFRFDYFDPSLDLSAVRLKNSQKNLRTFKEDKVVGIQKAWLWERLLFLLSLRGNVPLSTLCHHLRRSRKSFVCSNEYSKIAEVSYEECYYFGDVNCVGVHSKETLANQSYTCYDWIAFHRGGKHQIDLIETDDDFVNQIWFYPSDRIDGTTQVKDACIVSCLSKESLSDFDYSETMARFKTISDMESKGMKGKFNGYSPNGKPKHYKFKTSHLHREKYQDFNSSWVEEDGITTAAATEEDLLKALPQAALAYDGLLRKL
tara:strand:- start:875 stop:1729 length:855 start_codon:yes stop_codon:yes gene_type:complete